MSRVFVLGSFAVDTSYRAAHLPASGETLIGSSFLLGPGGKGSNQAVAAARAGAKVSFLTAIGRDAFGDIGRATWAAEGIDTSRVKLSEEATGAAAILVDETSGENAIVIVPGACGTLSAADVEASADAIRSAQVFLAQLEIPLIAVLRGLQIARAAGVLTVLNPAPAPSGTVPAELLSFVDFLIPNETEIGQMTGGRADSLDGAADAAMRMIDLGVGCVIVTLGERGSLLCKNGGLPVAIPASRSGTAIDTTGAGDAFCGCFAVSLAEGNSPERAAHFASVAAGISVTRRGAAASMPYRGEIEDRSR